MGLFRRGFDPADQSERPRDLEIPEGMAAIPADRASDMAAQLADEASEMAVSRPAPSFVDLSAKVALISATGENRVDGLAGGTQLLGYNLYLLGHWCRAAEMAAIDTDEVSHSIADYLKIAHDKQLWGDDWFGTLAGASHNLAVASDEPDEIVGAFHSALPDDTGENFRDYYAAVSISGMAETIDAPHPGGFEESVV